MNKSLKKIVKNTASVLIWVIVLLVVYIFVFFMPIRVAVKSDDIDESRYYVIAEPISVTEYFWVITKERDNEKETLIYTKVEGNIPDVVYEYSFLNEDNKFVFYGHYVEKTEDEYETSAVFYVDSYDVLYPVKHGVNGMFKGIWEWYISYLDIASDFNWDEFVKFFTN